MQEEHWHGSTMQNGRFTENRCSRDDLAGAQDWVSTEIDDEGKNWATGAGTASVKAQFRAIAEECRAYDGKSEAWEGSVTVDNIEYGFRIMSIDGMCEDML